MVSWISSVSQSNNNMIYIIITLGILVLLDIIVCINYVRLVKIDKLKKSSKKEVKIK